MNKNHLKLVDSKKTDETDEYDPKYIVLIKLTTGTEVIARLDPQEHPHAINALECMGVEYNASDADENGEYGVRLTDFMPLALGPISFQRAGIMAVANCNPSLADAFVSRCQEADNVL